MQQFVRILVQGPTKKGGVRVSSKPTGDSERSWLISTLVMLVESIGRALPPTSELLLHDLSKLPNSIVAITGDVTSRNVGDPATDLLLAAASRGDMRTRLGYETRLADGRRLRSSTVIVHDSAGTAAAAICINSDLSTWEDLNRISQAMLGFAGGDAVADLTPSPDDTEEIFPTDVDELAAYLIGKTTAESGISVELMRKKHKLAVVRELSDRGFFLLKGAVEKAAAALHVSRFTIYNYLNEISESPDASRTKEDNA